MRDPRMFDYWTGEIALLSPGPDAAKAEVYFEGALPVARKQSWELRAAMVRQFRF
jgi:hypothetical protein